MEQHAGNPLLRRRLLPLGEALLTALIWSSSFVGVKVALAYTGPFTVAGLRYFLAFLFLCPWLRQRLQSSTPLTRLQWSRFTLMGLAQYTIGNGALFLALKTVSATTGSLVLCLVPIPVLLLGILHLKERPNRLQLLGLTVAIGGSILFFSPGLKLGEPLAVGLLGVAVLSFSAFPVLGRKIARNRQVANVTLTALPLGIGGGILLILAGAVEGIPHMPLFAWGVILGLALVNTLTAYLLFNHSLQHLTAVEANLMLNLTPLGTAIIAWGTLDELLLPVQIAAMFLVIAGASLYSGSEMSVSVRERRSQNSESSRVSKA
jgi:drug/metabolite transporter (DMT)-like permease